jgi:ribose transport system substrate-binding protein
MAKFKTSLAVAMCGIVAAIAVGCGGSDSSGSTGTAASTGGEAASTASTASDTPVRVAFFGNSAANIFTQAHTRGVKKGVQDAGGTVTKVFDGKFDPPTQRGQIQDAVASGEFDAFVIETNDGATITPAVRDAIDEGIKVVGVFNPIGPNPSTLAPQIPGLTSTVGHNFEQGGKDLAELTSQACADTDPCKVAFMSGDSSLPLDVARTKGFKEQIATYPSIELVAQQDAGYDTGKGRTVTQNILQAHPDVNVITAAGDQALLGGTEVIKDAGKIDQIKLIGDGAATQGVKLIADGTWYGALVLAPESGGAKAGEIAVAAARGEKVPQEVNYNDVSPIGKFAKKDNLGSFKGEF